MSVAGTHHQLMSSCLPSRLSRVRFPSPALGRIRRYNACVAKAAKGRPPAFEAGRRDSVRLRPHHRTPAGGA